MQLAEIKAVNGYGFSLKALLTAALICLAGPSMAAVENAAAAPPVLSAPAVKAGQGSEVAVDDEASVSINQADAEQLASVLKGVGLKKAESIVRYREQNGPFTQIEQLQEVPGIGPALFERNRARLKM
ncbi:helix-hairpin-helix domain-containing protein [Serratia plymuthica]|uniref:ComEA family DNA-binding protein n=1 Tax=Serratia plymuthica TaxID=82996 RepID=UPI00045666FD|nr:helix-hairpin-helix domain-containing protein [Serratia plymuthica]AHY06002.1 competence protein ComEA [Serratia plymuthica]MBL3523885.1 helix-hairpin-helix domain-containing protein [Serratia plymuthica]MEB6540375.1 helix-hairpin-helix domain-containing protein [Serratia plymuthica]